MKKMNLFMMLIMVSFVIVSCSEEEEVVVPVAKKTIVDAVVDGADFTLLEAAVIHAGLVEDLKSDKITVFAPTDAAFKAAGFKDEAAIKAADKNAVKNILMYHVIGSLVPSSAIAKKDNEAVNMLSGKTYVSNNSNGVSVNGAKVITADVKAENGAIIHVINSVLIPETKNIVQLAQSNPNLSFLVAAVLRANEGTTKVVDILSAAGPYTVFAPTNDAFKAAGFKDEAAIKAADPAFLAKVLTYHVVASRVYSTTLSSGNVATAEGSSFSVNATDATIKGKSNTSSTKIIGFNVPASNGVVHVIDSVLIP